MRTTGQIGLALAAIIALVAGVTYLSQYGPSSGKTVEAVAPVGAGEKAPAGPEGLKFAIRKVEWSVPNEGDFERGSAGHHDFFFVNDADRTTLLGIDAKNCKCEDALVTVFDKDQVDKFPQWSGSRAATILAGLERGPLACVSLMAWEELAVPKLFGLNTTWEPLDLESKKGVPVPPKGGGLLRVRFKGKKDLFGAFLVKVRLWQEPQGQPAQRMYGDLELPITYVAPITLSSGQINLENFNARDEKSGALVIYSSTQAKFDLYVNEVHPSPLINVQINDLNNDEIADLQKVSGPEKRILAAKRVLLTVHERLSDSQRMDLGPFYRKIWVSTSKDDPEEASFVVGGEIRGELVVGSTEDRGRIDLKSFKARSGISKTVSILAQQPDLELDTKDISLYPESLQAHMKVHLEKLKPIGGEQRNHWHLQVTLTPGFPAGKMPEGSAVFLKIAGSNPPRQIRIPVNGMAYQ
jgi:hypothetical protein